MREKELKEREITYSTSSTDLNSINKLDLKQPAAEWNEKLVVKEIYKESISQMKNFICCFLFLFDFPQVFPKNFPPPFIENQSIKWFIEKELQCNKIKCWSMKRNFQLSVQFLSLLHHLQFFFVFLEK